MKTLLLLGSLLGLIVLAGCTKEEPAAPAAPPPPGVGQAGPGSRAGGPKVQTRTPGAASNQ